MAHVTIPDVATESVFVVTTSTTGPFTFAFSYFQTSDIRVAFNGTEISAANFTVTPTLTADSGFEGGSITLVSPVASGDLRVWRDVPSSRTTDFPTAGPFNVTALNTWLDKTFSILQQVETSLSRTLRMDDTEGATLSALPSKATRASKTLVFDANGNPGAGPTVTEVSNAQTYATNAAASASSASSSASSASSSASAAAASAAAIALPVAVASGGTGSTTAAAARTALAVAGTADANTFTSAQVFRAANSVRAEAASTQDAVVLAGRAGGTTSRAITLTPATLSSNQTQTLPDATGTHALTGGIAQSYTAAQRGAITALTDGATITPDFAAANNFSLTIGGSRTLANPTNQTAGQSGAIVITQDGTGGRTLAYGSNFKFAGGTAPTLTTTASAVDVLVYYVESASRITATMLNDVK